MMICETRGKRPQASEPGGEAHRAPWSLPDGQRLPYPVEVVPLGLGGPAHPARLLPSDLEDPRGFHSRLTAWLLRQG